MSISKLRRRIERARERGIDRFDRQRARHHREWESRRAEALRLIRRMEDFQSGRMSLVNA